MRILVLSSDYPPMRGGISRLSWQTAVGLAREHEVRVIAAAENMTEARRFDQEQPYPTVRVPGQLVARELGMAAAIRREVKRFRPEVIWSALWIPEAALVSYLVKDPRVLKTFSVYASEFIPSKATWRKRLKHMLHPIRLRLLRTADRIFPLSNYTRRRLLDMGADPARMRLLPGGVAEEWFAIEPARRNASQILTVARLDPNKGHDMVIRALPRILQEVPEARYSIIGPSTPHLDQLRSLARSLGVGEHVEYRGTVSEAQLKRAYAEADLFIMASREEEGWVEGFGLTFLEAAATGLTSVAGDSGGIPDAVVDGETGYLVDPTSPEAIANATVRMLKEPELRHRLGEQARRRAQDFRWDAIVGQMAAHFREALR